jgi:hypothetical protein
MTAMIFIILVLTLLLTLLAAAVRRKQRAGFIDAYSFPTGIRERVRKRYPHLSDAQLDLVFDALREYFHLCRKGGQRLLAMPSQVVDVAWHEFILFTRNYQHFCRRGLGRFLHHTPAEAMRTPTDAGEGLQRTWRLACHRAGMRPEAATAVPLLFAIDSQLAIADGFNYALDCRQALAARQAASSYCASHIGGGGGCGGGCAGAGCSSGSGSGGGDGDGGGCGGGGGD